MSATMSVVKFLKIRLIFILKIRLIFIHAKSVSYKQKHWLYFYNRFDFYSRQKCQLLSRVKFLKIRLIFYTLSIRVFYVYAPTLLATPTTLILFIVSTPLVETTITFLLWF